MLHYIHYQPLLCLVKCRSNIPKDRLELSWLFIFINKTIYSLRRGEISVFHESNSYKESSNKLSTTNRKTIFKGKYFKYAIFLIKWLQFNAKQSNLFKHKIYWSWLTSPFCKCPGDAEHIIYSSYMSKL